MRIVSWNMAGGFAFDYGRHERAWHYLRALDPDVALLQETVPPSWASEYWSMVFQPKYPDGRVLWGSAIVSKQVALSEHKPDEATPWLSEMPGSAVVAQRGGDQPLWLASIHSNAKEIARDLYLLRPVEDLLRCNDLDVWEIDVIAHELCSVFRDQRFIAGGDLNSSLLLDKTLGGESNVRLFGNLHQLGFHDLRKSRDEQQTYFKVGKSPHQLDHVFADVHTASSTDIWRVLPEVARDWGLSDHAPIEVIFNSVAT